MRVIGRDGGILLPVGLGERILAVGGRNAQHRRAQIRTILEGFRRNSFERHHQRLVFEFARERRIRGQGFVTQLLPEIPTAIEPCSAAPVARPDSNCSNWSFIFR